MGSVGNHLDNLKWKAAELDKKIHEDFSNYAPDDEVSLLKHEKFKIEEEIRLLELKNGKENLQNNKGKSH